MGFKWPPLTYRQYHALIRCCCCDPFEGSCPKTKPPPLLSLHRPPTSSLGGPNMRGPHIPHSGPSSSRGPLLHTAPPFHPGSRGPHGIRGAPPSLKSARLPLLASPGRFLLPPPFTLTKGLGFYCSNVVLCRQIKSCV